MGDYITVPNSTTLGTVKAIKDGDAAINSAYFPNFELIKAWGCQTSAEAICEAVSRIPPSLLVYIQTR